MLFQWGRKIIGHVFFQRHGNELRLFSLSIHEDFRKQGLSILAAEAFLGEARSRPRISKVRFGKGTHDGMKRILKNFGPRQSELGIQILNEGWVELCRD
jgi:hypothetical protein